jgi:hypothetical protein
LRGSTNAATYGETGTNAAFSVTVSGTPPFRYQWRFRASPIPGATNATLLIPSVTLAHDGTYDVLVRDPLGELTSLPATLSVLVAPGFVESPPAVTIFEGATLTVEASLRGNPPPFTFSWRRITPAQVFTNVTGPDTRSRLTLDAEDAGLTLSGNMLSTNIPCRLVISNGASSGPGLAQTFTVTVMADRDGDGMADEWENDNGLSPASAADAAQDADGDGLSNREEYVAGTDPRDATSYLRIDSRILPGQATVQFLAISNRTYTVERSDELGPGGGVWARFADVQARLTNRVENLLDDAWTQRRYYRVVTPRRP